MKKLLQLALVAFLTLTVANTYAQISEDFENVPGHAGTIKDYLILQNWQFPGFDVNPEGIVAIDGSQSMGSDGLVTPMQYTGVVTPFLNFSNNEALQFSFKLHRPLDAGFRRWFIVNIVDQNTNIVQVDSVEISATQTAATIYNLNISGYPGIFAIYINVRGEGGNSKLVIDDLYFSGTNAGINHPAGTQKTSTGINDVPQSASILSVYPNPTNSNLNIQLDSKNSQEAQIEVYNVSGAKVYSQTSELNGGANNVSVNVETLASGNYYVSIRTNDGVITKRFAKI